MKFEIKNERQKRIAMYLCLLFAAVVIAIIDRGGAWLAIAIAAGVLFDEITYLVAKHRKKNSEKNDLKENPETKEK